MKRYLITGGTGMVGRALVEQLTRSNEAIIYILTRSDQTSQQQHVHYINWSKDGWEEEVPHIDIVINLAGATLNKRWTTQHQQIMMTSRIQATRALFDLFKLREQTPDVLFNASAMGYYPPSKRLCILNHIKRHLMIYYQKSCISGKDKRHCLNNLAHESFADVLD